MQIHKRAGGRRPLFVWLSLMTLVMVVAACGSSAAASPAGGAGTPARTT